MKKSKIIFVIGLSASGKSTLINEYCQKGYCVYDDMFKYFHYTDYDSKYLKQIVSQIKEKRNIVLSDIMLTKKEVVEKFLENLYFLHPHFSTEFIYFENNPKQCLINSSKRVEKQANNHTNEIDLISELSNSYYIPDNIKTIKVFK